MNKNWREKRKKTRWEGIVKVQRPLVTNGSYCNCLVYNEDRSIMTELELSPEVMDVTFAKAELKTYWKATLKWSGVITLLEQVPEPSW